MSDNPSQPSASRRSVGRAARRAALETDPFYVLATSPLADEDTRVLKQGETFAVFDHYGDIKPVGLGEEGIYHEGTRFLSCLLLELGTDRPLFLSSTVNEDNDLLVVDLTNPDVRNDDTVTVERGTLHLVRSKFLWEGVCYECLRLRNYGSVRIESALTLHFEADYADIFEVRGNQRQQRGQDLDPFIQDDSV